jgi:CheY-like chemotaxis protein
MRILVVEDNPANQLLAETVLEREGFVVDVAGSAAEAVRRITTNAPDLIPVVALTAHAMVGDREAALAAGCNGHITKPIDVEKFCDEVRAFLPKAKQNGTHPD